MVAEKSRTAGGAGPQRCANIGTVHIQEPVRLVEHQMAHFPEAHHALGHEIEASGWPRGLRAAGQGLSLGPNGSAAEDAEAASFMPCGEATDV